MPSPTSSSPTSLSLLATVTTVVVSLAPSAYAPRRLSFSESTSSAGIPSVAPTPSREQSPPQWLRQNPRMAKTKKTDGSGKPKTKTLSKKAAKTKTLSKKAAKKKTLPKKAAISGGLQAPPLPKPSIHKMSTSLVAPSHATGRWTDVEESQFERGVIRYGWSNWRCVAALVPTRSRAQVKSHAQKIAKWRKKYVEELKVKQERYKTTGVVDSQEPDVRGLKGRRWAWC